jgi:hypothetical protein
MLQGAPGETAGLIASEIFPCRIEVNIDAATQRTRKKPRRDFLARMYHLAAALYWAVRLILMLWDRLTN